MGLFDKLRSRRESPLRPYVYPLSRTQERTYPPGYEGDLFIWDIDETYLKTDSDTVRGLLSVPLEMAVDKRNVAGTGALLRGLRRGVSQGKALRSNPLYFVSASPPQLRRVIERKMVLDGVEYDGITFKDQISLVLSGRIGQVKNHIAYKLSALLLNRRELPWGVRECAFGDDTETDALIYALYGDIIAGRLRGRALAATLRCNMVLEEDASYVARLASTLRHADLVDTIYIHLKRQTPPQRFQDFGPCVVPCYDTFQMALHLFERQRVDLAHLIEVGKEVVRDQHQGTTGLLRSAIDLHQRGEVKTETLAQVWGALASASLVPEIMAINHDAANPSTRAHDPTAFITPTRLLHLGEG